MTRTQMQPAERKEIEELIALYEQEHEVRDVYVEGTRDALLIRWLLAELGINDVSVYEIDDICVPASELIGTAPEPSNRLEVITLADKLLSAVPSASSNVTCIIDKDMAAILHDAQETAMLLMTDYANMEMYLYDSVIIKKYLLLVLNRDDDATTLLTVLQPVLVELFLIRVVKYVMDIRKKLLPLDRCCKLLPDNTIQFKSREFIERFLNKFGMRDQLNQFTETLAQFKMNIPEEPRDCMHGHDFTALLGWFLEQKKVAEVLCDEEVIGKNLWGCLTPGDLLKHSMFERLVQRLTVDL